MIYYLKTIDIILCKFDAFNKFMVTKENDSLKAR